MEISSENIYPDHEITGVQLEVNMNVNMEVDMDVEMNPWYSTQIGAGAIARHTKAVCIGYGAVSTRKNEINIGGKIIVHDNGDVFINGKHFNIDEMTTADVSHMMRVWIREILTNTPIPEIPEFLEESSSNNKRPRYFNSDFLKMNKKSCL